jgi:hypothetical protein
MKSGVIAGYPVVDVKATLFDGSYHDVDSSQLAFELAGRNKDFPNNFPFSASKCTSKSTPISLPKNEKKVRKSKKTRRHSRKVKKHGRKSHRRHRK